MLGAYGGRAGKYQEVEKALLDFQEVTHEYDRQRLTLQESQAIAEARAELEKAQARLKALVDKS